MRKRKTIDRLERLLEQDSIVIPCTKSNCYNKRARTYLWAYKRGLTLSIEQNYNKTELTVTVVARNA